MDFGVIYYISNEIAIVVMEGTETELLEYINTIKEIINKDATIKLLDKDRYNESKEDIKELTRLLQE